MNGDGKYDGPRMVTLLDGRMVFSDSEDWRAECEAREVAALPQAGRHAYLVEVARHRGTEAAERLGRAIDEVIAATAIDAERGR